MNHVSHSTTQKATETQISSVREPAAIQTLRVTEFILKLPESKSAKHILYFCV